MASRHLADLTSCCRWAWWPCWSWNVGGRPLTRSSSGWRCPFCRGIATSVRVKSEGRTVQIQFHLLLMRPPGFDGLMTLTEDHHSSVEMFLFTPTSAKKKSVWALLEERHSLTAALICNIVQCGYESWLAQLQTSKSSNMTTVDVLSLLSWLGNDARTSSGRLWQPKLKSKYGQWDWTIKRATRNSKYAQWNENNWLHVTMNMQFDGSERSLPLMQNSCCRTKLALNFRFRSREQQCWVYDTKQILY